MKEKVSSRFGKIIFPSTNQQIENCWLRLEGDKPYLEVPYDSFDIDNWDIIVGTFNGLDEVTFYKCDLGGGKEGRGGSFKRINFSFMFENKIFKEKSDILFTKVSLDSKALDQWVVNKFRLSYFETNQEENSLSIPKRKVIHKTNTKFVTISIIQGFDKSIGSYDADFQRKTLIEITFKQDLHFDEINKYLVRLKRLILFLTHDSPKIVDYSFVQANGSSARLKERSRFNDVSGFSEGIELNYLDIKPHLETIIKNWIEKEKLVQVIELIQEKYMNTSLSFQNYFLNCCVALESFHSKLIHKKSTLRERVTFFEHSIAGIKDDFTTISSKDFISKVVNTRNKIAHEGEYLEYLTEFELLLYGKVLEFVVKIEILKILGIEDKKLLEKFQTDAKNRVRILAEMNGYFN